MGTIRHAWNVELGRVVTAQEAKREFLNEVPRPESWRFLCANAVCRLEQRTRVTCVNYKKAPAEDDQSVAVSFRELDPHTPNCEYGHPTVAAETRLAIKERNQGIKLNDSFQVFDPGEAPSRPRVTPRSDSSHSPFDIPKAEGNSEPATPSAETTSSTRFVEDLAAIHVDSRNSEDARDALNKLIAVRGHGTQSLGSLFAHVKTARLYAQKKIWYGGARVLSYGGGFSLIFFDEVEGKPLTTYVSGKTLSKYRYATQLRQQIAEAADAANVTAYVWGSPAVSDRPEKASLDPDRLEHLALVMGPPKIPKVVDPSEGGPQWLS